MKKRFDVVERFENLLDWIRFQIEHFLDFFGEFFSDITRWMSRISGRTFGRSVIWLTDTLVIDKQTSKKSSYSSIVNLARRVVGVPVLIVIWAFVQVLVGIIGLLSTLFGLRRGTEYPWQENFVVWLPVIFLGLWLPFSGIGDFGFTQMIYVMSYSIIVLGLNLLVGVAGQMCVGHGAFVLVGAYVTVLLYKGELLGFSMPSVFAVLLGGAFASAIGMAIGLPTVRVKGPYLTLISLGLMLTIEPLIISKYLRDYTGGSDGLNFSSLQTPEAWTHVHSMALIYYLTLFFFCIMFISGHIIANRSKIGRAFKAIREGEEQSNVLGINVLFYKALAFAISAFYGGIGGGVLALSAGYIGPESYKLQDSLSYLVALMLGGIGTIFGSVIGGTFLAHQVYVTEFLGGFFPNGDRLLGVFFGILLLIVTILAPKGLAGEIGQRLNLRYFELPKRRHHRRDPFPDYAFDEEMIAASGAWTPEAADQKPDVIPKIKNPVELSS